MPRTDLGANEPSVPTLATPDTSAATSPPGNPGRERLLHAILDFPLRLNVENDGAQHPSIRLRRQSPSGTDAVTKLVPVGAASEMEPRLAKIEAHIAAHVPGALRHAFSAAYRAARAGTTEGDKVVDWAVVCSIARSSDPDVGSYALAGDEVRVARANDLLKSLLQADDWVTAANKENVSQAAFGTAHGALRRRLLAYAVGWQYEVSRRDVLRLDGRRWVWRGALKACKQLLDAEIRSLEEETRAAAERREASGIPRFRSATNERTWRWLFASGPFPRELADKAEVDLDSVQLWWPIVKAHAWLPVFAATHVMRLRRLFVHENPMQLDS